MTGPDDVRDLAGPWWVLAGLRFLAELAMLTALAYVGWRLAGDHQAVGVMLAVVLVGTASAVWGRWIAPQAPERLDDPARVLVEVGLFGTAVIGLLVVDTAGRSAVAGVVLAVAYLASAPVGRRGH